MYQIVQNALSFSQVNFEVRYNNTNFKRICLIGLFVIINFF
jgi:hypothetical protein